ncbi:hypothetical protein [Lactiplantibacillus plantarum]|uniref:hypothetical protein n=1 Tax=Lactiplantibacillus plantarum TaxID=1590 RepID=UPI0021A2F385|nr:hypothetical protein [Lactiplantibacillus plantarum]
MTTEQVKQLQKENRRLKEELDILKRVAELLAKTLIHSGRKAALFVIQDQLSRGDTASPPFSESYGFLLVPTMIGEMAP